MGMRSLEVPLRHSLLCKNALFWPFAVTFCNANRLVHESYNQELHEFRRANRIRIQTHPVSIPTYTRRMAGTPAMVLEKTMTPNVAPYTSVLPKSSALS